MNPELPKSTTIPEKAPSPAVPLAVPGDNADLVLEAKKHGLEDGASGADPKLFPARAKAELELRAKERFGVTPVFEPAGPLPLFRLDQRRVLPALGLAAGATYVAYHFHFPAVLLPVVLIAVAVATVALMEVVDRHARLTRSLQWRQQELEAATWVQHHSARICAIYEHFRARAATAARHPCFQPSLASSTTSHKGENREQKPAAC